MTQPAPDLRPIAHAALSLTEPPYLKHYHRGRFRTWNGVAFTGCALPGPGFNFAAVLHSPAPTLDELLPVARDFFTEADKGWGILVEGDAGHPMEAELKNRGWAVDEDEPAFVMPDILRAGGVSPPSSEQQLGGLTPPARRTAPPARQELTIRLATTPEDVAAYHRVTTAAFGAPPEFAELFAPGPGFATDPDIGLFVGAVAGEDVAVVGFSKSGPTAVVWGTATLEPHRGRGHGAELVRAALAEAVRRGCTSAALRSGPKSVPLYERLGFWYVCQHRTYRHPAG